MSNTLRDTIYLINSIRRRIQFMNNIYTDLSLIDENENEDEYMIRRIETIRDNVLNLINETNFEENLRDEINISIQFNNNITNLLNNFINNVGSHLMNNTDINYENFVNLPTQEITLTEQEFNKKIEDIEKEVECGICQERGTENVVCLKFCKHEFCKSCLKEWLTKYNVNCPICRKDTREIS